MTNDTPLSEQGFDALANRFECDMRFDAHGYEVKFGRSQARGVLQERGGDILETLVQYLETQADRLADLDTEVTNAWLRLLDFILRAIDNKKVARSPPDYTSISAWTTFTRVHFAHLFS